MTPPPLDLRGTANPEGWPVQPQGEVKSTALFAALTTPHASELAAHLAGHGILVRHAEQPALLRFGLPGDEAGWQRLAAALSLWKPA